MLLAYTLSPFIQISAWQTSWSDILFMKSSSTDSPDLAVAWSYIRVSVDKGIAWYIRDLTIMSVLFFMSMRKLSCMTRPAPRVQYHKKPLWKQTCRAGRVDVSWSGKSLPALHSYGFVANT